MRKDFKVKNIDSYLMRKLRSDAIVYLSKKEKQKHGKK